MTQRTAGITTRAFLLRRVDYGETDLVVTLLTEALGRVSAIARGARRSRKRFGGTLEPMHTLTVRFDDRAHAELGVLREASIERARLNLTGNLRKMEAAGRALGWVRRALPPRTPEPEVLQALEALLDRLDDGTGASEPRLHLTEFGLRLLAAVGWGLDLNRCVSCGKPCENGRSALVDAARGGLICRACGGAKLALAGGARARLALAAAGQAGALHAGDVEAGLDLVEQALRAHMGFD